MTLVMFETLYHERIWINPESIAIIEQEPTKYFEGFDVAPTHTHITMHDGREVVVDEPVEEAVARIATTIKV